MVQFDRSTETQEDKVTTEIEEGKRSFESGGEWEHPQPEMWRYWTDKQKREYLMKEGDARGKLDPSVANRLDNVTWMKGKWKPDMYKMPSQKWRVGGFIKTISLAIAGDEPALRATLGGDQKAFNQFGNSPFTRMQEAELGVALTGFAIGGRGAAEGRAVGYAAIRAEGETLAAERTQRFGELVRNRRGPDADYTVVEDLTPEDLIAAHEAMYGIAEGKSQFRDASYNAALENLVRDFNRLDVRERNQFVLTHARIDLNKLEAQIAEAKGKGNDYLAGRLEKQRAKIEDYFNEVSLEDTAMKAAEAKELLVEAQDRLSDAHEANRDAVRIAELEAALDRENQIYQGWREDYNQKIQEFEKKAKEAEETKFQEILDNNMSGAGALPRSFLQDLLAYQEVEGKNMTYDLSTTEGRSEWFNWRSEYHKLLRRDDATGAQARADAVAREVDLGFEDARAENAPEVDPEVLAERARNKAASDATQARIRRFNEDQAKKAADDLAFGKRDFAEEQGMTEWWEKNVAEEEGGTHPVTDTERLVNEIANVDTQAQMSRYETWESTFNPDRFESETAANQFKAYVRGIASYLTRRSGETAEAYLQRARNLGRKASRVKNFLLEKEGEVMVARYYNEGESSKEKPKAGGAGGVLSPVVAALAKVAVGTVKAEDEQGGSFTGTGKMAVRQILDRVNLDELLQKCLNLSLDTYNPDVTSSPEAFPNVSYYRNNRLDGKEFDVPFLIYTEGSELFVAFRGTSTLANVVTDISTSALGESLPNRIADYEFPVEQHAGRLEVHAGFLKSVHEIYSFLISRIKKVSVISDVHFTGHSLGGAVANLCAYIYSNDTDMSLPALGYAISFGAPRMLFDKEDYKEDYMKSVPKCIRVWNTRDPVPYLPFKKPVLIDYFGTRMASGFTHVGKSFDLTSNQVNCNINVLLYLILMGNKSKVKTLLEQVPTAEANKLLDFMVTPDFQTLLLQGFFTCAERVSVNKGYTQEDIDFVMEQLQTSVEKLGSYNEKCERLRPYGLADMMKANNLTDDVQEENFCIPGIMGMCVGANKTMTEAHRGLYYKAKLTELIDKQAAEQKFIYEVEDKDHEVFIPTNDESVKELAETSQTKFERRLSMIRGLVFESEKEMQMLNGQVIVY